jgi:hypothetical protein
MTGRTGRALIAAVMLLALVVGLTTTAASQGDKERIGWLIADKATVTQDVTVLGSGSVAGDFTVVGTMTAGSLVSTTQSLAITGNLTQVKVNAASGSANPYDYTGTLGIMNGSDSFEALDINITNADHTGTAATNTIRALDIAGMTADANAVENAIYLGAGWDADISAVTSLEIAVDDTGVVVVKDPAGADSAATNEMVEIAGTTPIDTTGTNVHDFLTIDAAIGNSSAGTNSVVGLQIDGITGDAQVTETGVHVGSGWDYGADFDSPVNLDGAVTSSSTIAQTLTNSAGASANPYDYTATLGIMNGSDTFEALDINITNADHTGTAATNTVRALDIAGMTADANAYESAIYLGAGWDNDVNGATSLELASDDVVVVTVKDPAGADSAATNEMVEIAGTTPVDTTGTNTHDFLTIDAAIGNSSAGTNVATGLQVDDITGDAQVTENGVNVGSGWDYGVVSASPVQINSTLKVTGAANLLVDVSIITTDTVLTAADSGTTVVFKNGATFQNTVTLPAAAAGLSFCFYNYEGDDVEVDAPTGDQIHHYTSTTDEEIDNTTAGDWICLVAIDGTDWIGYSIEGTWSDD